MYPVPTQCPVCNYQLHVTQVTCERCTTTLSGHFSLGRLQQLSPEQLNFVEVFLLCEGKINRVEQELGMSYPAVRSQLQEVINVLEKRPPAAPPAPPAVPPMTAMPTMPAMPPTPAAPPPTPTLSDEQRRAILAKVSAGEISAQEAAAQLRQTP